MRNVFHDGSRIDLFHSGSPVFEQQAVKFLTLRQKGDWLLLGAEAKPIDG